MVCLTPKGLVRVLRTFAVNIGYNYTSEEVIPSRISWCPTKKRTPTHRKVE